MARGWGLTQLGHQRQAVAAALHAAGAGCKATGIVATTPVPPNPPFAHRRYQAAYRELARKHPSFRARSETTDLIVDISLQVRGGKQRAGGTAGPQRHAVRAAAPLDRRLFSHQRTTPPPTTMSHLPVRPLFRPRPPSPQPFRSFRPDGVILFSDILTPLPAIGVPFEIDDNKGPLIDDPFRSADQVRARTAGRLRPAARSTLPAITCCERRHEHRAAAEPRVFPWLPCLPPYTPTPAHTCPRARSCRSCTRST